MDKYLKIMLAEEGNEFGTSCAGALRSYGYDVTLVPKDGTQVIERLAKNTPDVLLMDTFMQRVDALGVMKEMKNTDMDRNSDLYKINSLTKREMEVLVQVANGMFNKEIAISLNISERTVKNHLSNIFKKLEVSDRTQAAVIAIKNNIVEI